MDGSDRPIADNDDDQKIAPPWAAHRGLLVTVLGMGLLIVVGIAVVAYGLVYKMSEGEESVAANAVAPSVEPYLRRLELDRTQGIRGYAIGDLLAIEGTTDDGRAVIILFEPRSGREVGRLVTAGMRNGPP